MTEPDGDAQPRDEPGDRPELDIDTAFAAIVAGFSTPTPPGVGSWPEIENLPDESPDAGATGDPDVAGFEDPDHRAPGPDNPDGDAGPSRAEPDPPVPRPEPIRRRIVLPGEENGAAAVGRTGDRADVARDRSHHSPRGGEADDEEGYVPPEPPPLPRGDLTSRLAWGAVIGGPVFLLVAALAWRTLPSLLLLLALLAFVTGFVTLVARMPQDRPDDPDDGAVV